MSDIDSNLPVRAAAGDVVVNVLGGTTGGVVIDPASEGSLKNVLAGVTGIQAVVATESTSQSILAGVTGIQAVVATESTAQSILAGVTGIRAEVAKETTQASVLAGVTGIQAIVATETTQASVLAGVTGIQAIVATENTSLDILAGVTGGNAIATDVLAGVTGIRADLARQLPAALGATGMAASLSVAMATDQSPVPVYITAGASNTPVVEFTRAEAVATNAGMTGSYVPATAFTLDRVQAAGSGRIKVEVFAGLIAGWAYDDTRRLWVAFNSTSMPNVDIDCSSYKMAATTTQVKVLVTNLEAGKTQDLYCTIVGDKV